jgi:hypothetical protein
MRYIATTRADITAAKGCETLPVYRFRAASSSEESANTRDLVNTTCRLATCEDGHLRPRSAREHLGAYLRESGWFARGNKFTSRSDRSLPPSR